MKKTWKKLAALGLGLLLLTACGTGGQSSAAAEGSGGQAQSEEAKTTDFPKTQINMIVQSSPGGLSDQVTKETGDLMGQVLGETVI